MMRTTACCDLFVARPDVAEVDRLAVLVVADGILGEVDVDRAGQGVGNDQRRGSQIVGFDIGWIRPSKLRLPDKHGGDGQIVVVDGLADLFRQRAAVSDAGGAAVPGEGEA